MQPWNFLLFFFCLASTTSKSILTIRHLHLLTYLHANLYYWSSVDSSSCLEGELWIRPWLPICLYVSTVVCREVTNKRLAWPNQQTTHVYWISVSNVSFDNLIWSIASHGKYDSSLICLTVDWRSTFPSWPIWLHGAGWLWCFSDGGYYPHTSICLHQFWNVLSPSFRFIHFEFFSVPLHYDRIV